MRLLFVGDIVGRPGRRAVSRLLGGIVDERSVDFVVANCENAAGGIGVTPKIADELLARGIDVLTGGNHTWNRRDVFDYLDSSERILRPANYPPGAPGRGAAVVTSRSGVPVGIVNLEGRVFMRQIDCPFREGRRLVDELLAETPIVLVDIHAEATSEKLALGWYLAGRASAVVGTHTHIQTADERILEGHTAYITDAGMTGPWRSVIGVRTELSVARFVTGLPQRFETADGPSVLSGFLVDIDETTGAARAVDRVLEHSPDEE
ncbi:MAG: TIGR00282 family metallophosphoesterase [Candidatus Eisenbacteria bacterium]|nr:TIGR00282 family metallophosphoesterase [Candidatus Eisenbacteria bacterium]